MNNDIRKELKNEYKNYKIDKIKKGFVVYPINSFKDNVILPSLEKVYNYVDKDIKRIISNNKDRIKRENREREEN